MQAKQKYQLKTIANRYDLMPGCWGMKLNENFYC